MKSKVKPILIIFGCLALCTGVMLWLKPALIPSTNETPGKIIPDLTVNPKAVSAAPTAQAGARTDLLLVDWKHLPDSNLWLNSEGIEDKDLVDRLMLADVEIRLHQIPKMPVPMQAKFMADLLRDLPDRLKSTFHPDSEGGIAHSAQILESILGFLESLDIKSIPSPKELELKFPVNAGWAYTRYYSLQSNLEHFFAAIQGRVLLMDLLREETSLTTRYLRLQKASAQRFAFEPLMDEAADLLKKERETYGDDFERLKSHLQGWMKRSH